ncbi:hypothetical protein T10_2011 [Trichinella papuae]|uniref:Uncharacterized protein n=1 Tax=Trichinella papuae TaxID=268474 RepID=A0A0V1LWM1_9BILA|nr:hypothetical protein T10_2011 [Trichinella papuae]
MGIQQRTLLDFQSRSSIKKSQRLFENGHSSPEDYTDLGM